MQKLGAKKNSHDVELVAYGHGSKKKQNPLLKNTLCFSMFFLHFFHLAIVFFLIVFLGTR